MSQDQDTGHGETEETFEDAILDQEFAPDAILAHMSERKPLPPGDLKRLLSQKTRNKGTTDDKDQQPAEIEVNGLKHRQAKMRRLRHQHMDHTPSSRDDNHGALVDRGPNGGICGHDARLISKSPWVVTMRGLDHQEIPNMPLVTAGGVMNTSSGDAVAIMHQYAHLAQGRTIHSCGQMEHNGLHACNRSAIVGGKQLGPDHVALDRSVNTKYWRISSEYASLNTNAPDTQVA